MGTIILNHFSKIQLGIVKFILNQISDKYLLIDYPLEIYYLLLFAYLKLSKCKGIREKQN